jgi:hypothetical protein
MKTRTLAVCIVVLSFLAGHAASEQLYYGVYGTVSFDDNEYWKKVGGVWTVVYAQCSSPSASPFGLHFGTTGYEGGFGVPCYGNVSGVVSAYTEISGLQVSNSLLPAGSYYRFQAALTGPWDIFCPSGWDCGLDYQIGSVSGRSESNTFLTIDTAPVSMDAMPFYFYTRNVMVTVGCCCGVAGSSEYRWVLHAPGPISVHSFPLGSTDPYSLGSTGVTLELHSCPGGMVTAVNVPGDAPSPPTTPVLCSKLPRYWEVCSDMPSGSFEADLTITYSPGEIPADMEEENLLILRFDTDLMCWEALPTSVDLGSHKVATSGLTELSIFIIGDSVAAGVNPTSWGTCWGWIKGEFEE